MSLSFVASAVQTTTADGGFEETKIESKQIEAINQRNANKPLFEQLRQNQEEEQAKQEELQREMMRGTRALDEEDVAHLQALAKQRQERERLMQQRTQEELMLFRAARAERQQGSLDDDDDDNDDNREEGPGNSTLDNVGLVKLAPRLAQNETTTQNVIPKIVVKKRKRRVDPENKELTKEKPEEKKTKEDQKDQISEKAEAKDAAESMPTPAGLTGLLSGYGSDDGSES